MNYYLILFIWIHIYIRNIIYESSLINYLFEYFYRKFISYINIHNLLVTRGKEKWINRTVIYIYGNTRTLPYRGSPIQTDKLTRSFDDPWHGWHISAARFVQFHARMNSPIPEPITTDWLSFAIPVIFTRHLRSPKDHRKPGFRDFV